MDRKLGRRERPSRARITLALALVAIGLVSLDDQLASSSTGGGTPVTSRIVVGCTAGRGGPLMQGPRSRRVVALTFDDGPSALYTPNVLAILNRLHASATFFEEGRHVAGNEALMRQILASGDEIGNHSFNHPEYPGYRELASTNKRIRAATGFTPCLFRPPYGLIDTKVESAARRTWLRMVLWDVDSHDDKHPGAAVIHARVLALTRPGSIILMHDGGRHPQTVQALPGVIRGLRARGFRFATVTQLTGGRFLFHRTVGWIKDGPGS
ncbi:MAG TPA: polysaccharide deacetylase family protein [Solirubrobacterales bacterium]|nr:polysaccharide deacetylase family protein [Solirubrobacterales bacterium]